MMSESNVVELKQINKTYGEFFALRGVDCGIEKGSWTSLIGPSGSGKTTLLNIIGAMDRPTSGSVVVAGTDITGLDAQAMSVFRRMHIGFVFQQHHLVPYLSSVENVMLAQHFHSMADESTAREALGNVGLLQRAGHFPSQLSGGERQRVCIARALINEPEVLLLDEPTGNLDWANAQSVLELISRLHKDAGFTVICVTHNDMVTEWGNRVLHLMDGEIVESRNVLPKGDNR